MADHLVQNRKARFEYEVLETVEAGIVLTGTEVKSCRGKHINLTGGYAKIEGGEAWLFETQISPYEQGNRHNHEPMRRRKLLLHKREIGRLARAVEQKGHTLVPLRMYLVRGKVKVALGICRGKAEHDKRESLKKRDDQRRMQQALRQVQK